jgi:hypothetical protein
MLPMGYALLYKSIPLGIFAVLWMVVGMFGWIIEPVAEGDDDEPEPGTAPGPLTRPRRSRAPVTTDEGDAT